MSGKATAYCDHRTSSIKVWRRTAFYSLLLPSMVSLAGPNGGQVVGGSGSISQSGTNTTINQTSQNMAIDWQSYNLNANERVQYIQPNSSSLSLNNILSQNGSSIAGRIDANGQVILVNPNGIFFTATSVINVGGIIASGLMIQPDDFMNGNYIFNEVLGSEGAVINHGMINASLGGNVALIGRQVENDGVIVANLGSVALAAGKQAVLTFDQGGLLGVRVSEAILQEELGVDPAVLNSGNIQAAGGQVLLTASVSQAVFSQAMNSGDLDHPLSVVMHEDGSFTLGSGADLLNSGTVDTSTTSHDHTAGKIVLLGDNITSSGALLANAENGNGGDIELHAQNTTLLTENSLTSARSESNGQGGIIKVLGDRTGLFGQSTVDVSGANGGGQVLVGGDYRGENSGIRNSRVTYVGRDSQLYADALVAGDGGSIIHWADDSTFFYGSASAKGGVESGDGGLVEVSGKIYLDYDGNVNTTALNGETGLLLLDPTDITILDGIGDTNPDGDTANDGFDGCPSVVPACSSNGVYGQVLMAHVGPTEIYESELEGISATTNIRLEATNNITINNLAGNSLDLQTDSDHSVTFVADADGIDGGDFQMNTGDSITTQGGAVSISGANISVGDIDTTGQQDNAGGDITLTATGTINAQDLTTTGGRGNNSIGSAAGSITVSTGGEATIEGDISAIGGQGERDGDASSGGGAGGTVSVTSTTNSVSVQGVISNGGEAHGTVSSAPGGTAGTITLSGNDIALNQDISAVGGAPVQEGDQGDGNTITFNGPVTLTNGVTIDAQGTVRGAIDFTGTLDGTENLTLHGGDIDFSDLIGSNTRLGDLLITATGAINAGSHTMSVNSLNVTQSSGFTAGGITTRNADNSDTDSGQIRIIANTSGTENIITVSNINTSAGTRANEGTGNNGGNVSLTGRAITVASINSSGSTALGIDNDGGAAGTLQINANEGSGAETSPSITLNGDINARGGAGTGTGSAGSTQTAELTLTSATTASVTINHTTDFTSAITLTGSDGSDTLNAADRENNWSLASTDNTLNSNLTFSGIEIVIGNNGIDNFLMREGGFINQMNGGAGPGINTLIGRNADNIWNLTNGGNTLTTRDDTAYVTDFSNIDTLTGGNGNDTLNGFDSANVWAITEANGGTLLNNGQISTFSEMETLNGAPHSDDTLMADTPSLVNLTGFINATPTPVSIVNINTLVALNPMINSNNIVNKMWGSDAMLQGKLNIDSPLINNGKIDPPQNIVIHDDGSFTLSNQ